MSIVIRCLSLRIRMSERPACESFLRMCSRIFRSSSSAPANSFLPTIQFDFQSWMTPTRRPPGCTFWPIRQPPPSSCASSASRRVGAARGTALARARLLAARRAPAGCGDRLELVELDRDVARALEDPVDAAACTRAPALDRRALVDEGRLDVEIVAVPRGSLRLGVRDRAAQHLLDVARGGARA